LRRAVRLLLAVGLLLTGHSAVCAEEAAAAITLDVGYDGVYQVGRWTPVAVRPPQGFAAEKATVTVVDVDSRPVSFPLARQNDGGFTGQFQSGRLDAPLHVSLTTADGATLDQTFPVGGDAHPQPLRQTTQLWMTVGKHTGFKLGADLLNAGDVTAARGPQVRLVPMPVAELPATADALGSVQVLVLGNEALSAEQSTAVREWVARGGRLVVTVGTDVSRYKSGPLAGWVPVTVEDAYDERQTAALTGRITAFVPNKGILRSLDALQAARLSLPSGVVLIDGPTAPVAVRAAYGLGIVTVVGLDLEAAPFSVRTSDDGKPREIHWGGLAQMCVQFAGAATTAPGAASGDRQLQLAPTGVSDVASQIAGILDDFPGVERASSWNVIGLLGVYLLLIGPVDYLVVHRLLRKPQLTWVTLPAWVLLASWWATALADEDNGQTAASRQLEVLDVAADTGVQRLSTWFSLYSPTTRRHDVSWRPLPTTPPAAESGVRVAALARPEEGFRGMYRRGGINLGGAGYEVEGSPTEAESLQTPVDQWSSLVFAGDAYAFPPAGSPPLAECRQAIDTSGALRTFELTHQLPGEIEDWFVVQRMEVTFPMPNSTAPPKLKPGDSVDLTRGCGQKLLKAFIQGELVSTVQRKTGVDTYIRADEYDPLGRDPLTLFRALSFFDAIGGEDFTHLTNQSLDRLDLSPSIHLDRVVVFGRLTRPVADFSVDGEPVGPRDPATFVRIVVPITRVPAPPPLPIDPKRNR
jgi:hypothetical protein